MTHATNQLPQSNPFSTRYTRPGAIDFLFPDGLDAKQVCERLSANENRGAIIGPHGSGKSTLLQTLIPLLEERGLQPHLVSLHDRQRRMPLDWAKSMTAAGIHHRRPLLIIDGYEQLRFWSRFAVGYHCQRKAWGLLVTAHRPTLLPTILTTQPTKSVMQSLSERLQPVDGRIITPIEAADAYQRANGNVREALFDLYDRYEQVARPQNKQTH